MECSEQLFMNDVTDHEMIILRDDGVHRHVRFRRPGTGIMGFDLITWPGHLCYTGDMGTYVFRRLKDMFEFFRDSGHLCAGEKTLPINMNYWAEKLEAIDRQDGLTEYSANKFRALISEWLDESDASIELREAVVDRVLSRADDGEHEVRRAVYEFEYEGFVFHDFFEVSLREYTYRFVWCCYALAWGIQQYDGVGAQSRIALEPAAKT